MINSEIFDRASAVTGKWRAFGCVLIGEAFIRAPRRFLRFYHQGRADPRGVINLTRFPIRHSDASV